MPTFGKGFSVASAIANSGTSNNTLFTVPANSYALFNVLTGGTGAVTIDGQHAVAGAAANEEYHGVVAGPGQVVALNSASGTWRVSGVIFTNS